MSFDALMYASIKNNIKDSNSLNLLSSSITPMINIPNTIDGVDKYFTNILNETAIKRACCMASGSTDGTVKVRIPIPSDIDINKDIDPLRKKYGYYDKVISVPASVCKKYPEYTPGSVSCNNFYKTYCENIKYLYKLENNNNFNQGEWINYKKECSCYGEVPPEMAQFAPLCYMAGCNSGDTTIYLDPPSRNIAEKSGGACPTTICNAYLNIKDVSAGNSVNTNANFQQNCSRNNVIPPVNPPDNPPVNPPDNPPVNPPDNPIINQPVDQEADKNPNDSSSGFSFSDIFTSKYMYAGWLSSLLCIICIIIIVIMLVF